MGMEILFTLVILSSHFSWDNSMKASHFSMDKKHSLISVRKTQFRPPLPCCMIALNQIY